jgi:hypothetical protein
MRAAIHLAFDRLCLALCHYQHLIRTCGVNYFVALDDPSE